MSEAETVSPVKPSPVLNTAAIATILNVQAIEVGCSALYDYSLIAQVCECPEGPIAGLRKILSNFSWSTAAGASRRKTQKGHTARWRVDVRDVKTNETDINPEFKQRVVIVTRLPSRLMWDATIEQSAAAWPLHSEQKLEGSYRMLQSLIDALNANAAKIKAKYRFRVVGYDKRSGPVDAALIDSDLETELSIRSAKVVKKPLSTRMVPTVRSSKYGKVIAAIAGLNVSERITLSTKPDAELSVRSVAAARQLLHVVRLHMLCNARWIVRKGDDSVTLIRISDRPDQDFYMLPVGQTIRVYGTAIDADRIVRRLNAKYREGVAGAPSFSRAESREKNCYKITRII